jgi:hypothetical protein
MPALERRGTISHTTHLPVDSAFLLPTSSSSAAGGGGGAGSAKAALKSLLGYTASVTSDAAHYMSKSLTAATGGGTTSKGTQFCATQLLLFGMLLSVALPYRGTLSSMSYVRLWSPRLLPVLYCRCATRARIEAQRAHKSGDHSPQHRERHLHLHL